MNGKNLRAVVSVMSLVLGTILLWFPAHLLSQGTAGRILGSVVDDSGSVIPNATVTVSDMQRGTARTLTTDQAGLYVAPALQSGTYEVRAEAKGFQAVDRPGLTLEVGQDLRIDFSLRLGEQSQVVTVTGEAPIVQTTNAILGGVISNQTMNELPINGRDYVSLVTLRPGMFTYVGGGGLPQSSNNLRVEDNIYMLEGMSDFDPWFGEPLSNKNWGGGDVLNMLSIEAIDEFKEVVNPSAEYGWKPGVAIDVGVKSGTNSIHGTAFAYGRSSAFDARNYFDAPPFVKQPLNFEQYGGSIGGHIKKDKLFYFLNYESQQYWTGNPARHTFPITAPTGGTATTNLEVACTSALTNGGVAALSAQMAGLNSTTCAPLANAPGLFPSNNGSTTVAFTDLTSTSIVYTGLAKVDYHINSQHQLSFMYLNSEGSGPFADNAALQYTISQVRNPWAHNQVGQVNWTWLPSSTLVNEARVRYTENYDKVQSVDAAENPANYPFNGSTYNIYTAQSNPIDFGLPTITITGFSFEMGGAPLQDVGPLRQTQFVDNVSVLHGNHAFKFGVQIIRNLVDENSARNAKGVFNFPNLQSFFNGIPNTANFLTGDTLRLLNFWQQAEFFQDDWRVTRKLTLNLGLRYELATVVKDANNLLGNFDPVQGLEQVGKQISSPYNGEHYNFAPRLGLAWDVRGNGKTVVRASGNLMYEQINLFPIVSGMIDTMGVRATPTGAALYAGGIQLQGPGGNIGIVSTSYTGSSLTSTTTPGAIAYDWINNGPGNPLFSNAPTCGDGNPVANVLPTPQPCNVEWINKNLRTPYVYSWSLDVERAITNSLSLDVAYVGNHGTHLLSVVDVNQPQFVNGISPGWGSPATVGSPAYNCLQSAPLYNACSPSAAAEQAARPFEAKFPYLKYIIQLSNLNRSNYDALQATLTQRLSHGLTLLAAYTYGHGLADADSNTFAALPINSQTPGMLYGSSENDVRHRLTLSATYALPGKKSPLQLLKGWSVNSIVTLQSGLPWNVQDSNDDFSGTGETGIPLIGKLGEAEQWDFVGNPSDFTMIHGFTNYNGGIGGLPFFKGTSVPSACTNASEALGPLGLASLADHGCFALGNSVLVPPAYGTFGTTGRSMFRDSGFKNVDFSISKEWSIKERLTAQFRTEIFNIFNHPTFANPYGAIPGGASSTNPAAGAGFACGCVTADVGAHNSVLGSGGNREMQLGLKLIF